MASKALVPKLRKDESLRDTARDESPFGALQREMNRLFDGFFRSWSGMTPSARFDEVTPRVDVTENEKNLEVSAELPGMAEKDVEVTLSSSGTVLSLRGEKKIEREQKERGYYHMERAYGSFHRAIPLPCAVVEDKVEATFKDGVLHITLPKHAAQKPASKKIPIATGH